MGSSGSIGGKLVLSAFSLLFGICFTAVGIFAGIRPLVQQGQNWLAARSYVQVPARVDSVDLAQHRGSKGGATYLVKASFSYEFQGRHYVSHRASFSEMADNIGDYHQRLHQQLVEARAREAPVSLWVDPGAPENAVYDRTIRWQMLLFHVPFALLFPAIGIGAWYILYRVWLAGPGAAARVQSGQTVRLRPNRSGTLFLFGFTLFWNLLAWPIALLAIAGGSGGFTLGALIAAIFPAIGLVLLYVTWQAWRKDRPAGKPVLEISSLHPLRGVIHFQPPLGHRASPVELLHDVAVDAKLVRDVGKGKQARTETLWEERIVNTRLPRGTETLDLTVTLQPLREGTRHQIALHLAGTTLIFEL